jgi:hypothetical protein
VLIFFDVLYLCYTIGQLLRKVRKSKCAPTQLHRSHGYSLFKKELAIVQIPFDSQRLAHGFDPIGGSYFTWLYRKAKNRDPRPYECGYVALGRRGTDIKQQLIALRRLKQASLSPLKSSYDMHAFLSAHRSVLGNQFQPHMYVAEFELLQQRWTNASTHLVAWDGRAYARIGSGASLGDFIFSDMFRVCYQNPLDARSSEHKHSRMSNLRRIV